MSLTITANKSVHRAGSLPAPSFAASGASGTVTWSAVTDSEVLQGYVATVYQAAVLRPPTMGEANAGLSALAAAHGSLASFQAAAQSLLLGLFQSGNYNLNTVPPRTAREFVGSLYDTYLLRPPTDLAGWDFWTAQVLSNGDDATARANVLAAFAALTVNGAESEFGLKTRALWEATAGGTMSPLTGATSTLQAVNRTTLVAIAARDGDNMVSVSLQLEGVLPYPPDFQSQVEEDDPATLSLAADNYTRIVGYTGRRRRKWSCRYGKRILAHRDGLRTFLAWHRLDKYFWVIDKASGFAAKVVLDSKRSYNALRQHLHDVEFTLVEYDDGSPAEALALPPQPDPCIADTIVRSAPSGLTATLNGTAQIDLTWTRNATDNTGVEMQFRVGNSGAWQALATLGAAVTTYAHTGLIAGATYEYRLRNAWDDTPLASAWSGTAYATTPIVPYVVSINRATGFANPRSDGSMRWRVTFSESVTGLLSTHFVLTVVSGNLVDQFVDQITPVTGSNSAAYDVDVSDAAGTGILRLDLPPNAAIKDADNNPLVSSFTAGQMFTVDQTAPVLVSGVIEADAYTITLTYDEVLDAASVPPASAFVVHSATDPVVYTGGVHVSGASVTLDLDNVILAGETVKTDYNPPSIGKLRDRAGNNAASLSDYILTNHVP